MPSGSRAGNGRRGGPALIAGYRRGTGLPDTTATHIAAPILIAGGLPVLLGAVARFASR
ncbi:hypothetical protein [Nocardia nova]|uniref:hypothetical protein n=1 Tax=Nocardia nova TaxID=37330 RepID=UPI00340A0A1E